MKPNPVKQKLAQGDVALGTMVFEFASTGIGRIAAAAGAEFVIFDMEHTGWSLETVRMLMATTGNSGLMPLVRVPATEYHFLARALDVGAMGLMVPMVESAEQARRIVESAKYPPAGRRGAAFAMAHDDYQGGDLVDKMRSADTGGLLIAQIETAKGLDNVEAIAAVDVIDVLWVGQFDLTNSLGVAGELEHPRYHAAVDRVLAACKRHGRAAGFMAGSVEQGRAAIAKGFRMLAYSGDIWLYQQALRDGLAGLRRAGPGG
jgi:2-dehydro-3-deoxyglucarate aldolase/4-hydroxy-2-oxoheptanedioate aldolase